MDQRDPRADLRPEPDDQPRGTPEPTTPPPPVSPVPAYRPPRTAPFRTSALGEEATSSQDSAASEDRRGARAGTHEPAATDTRSKTSDAGPASPGKPGSGQGGAETPSGDPEAGSLGPGAVPGAAPDRSGDRGGAAASPIRRPSWPQHSPPPPRRSKHRSLAGPLVLIFVGLFFLGQSLGLIHWSFWEVIWRLWPIWLIAAGLDMLFGHRGTWGRLVVAGITIALVAGIVLGVQPMWSAEQGPERVAVQRAEPVPIAQPLEGITSAEVRIESTVSSLRLRGEAMTDHLIMGTVLPLTGEQVRWTYDTAGDRGLFRLYSEPPTGPSGSHQGHWDLVLTDRIPITLRISTGVGESDIDLSELTVPDLDVDAGVGRVAITLPEQGAVTGRIHAGVGEVTLRVSADRPARIRVDTALGGLRADAGFLRQGDAYVTPAYAERTAALETDAVDTDAIDLVVYGGVGSVHLILLD